MRSVRAQPRGSGRTHRRRTAQDRALERHSRGPSDPTHVGHPLRSGRDEIERTGRATVAIGGREFEIGKEFVDDLSHHDQLEQVARLDRPLLVVHPVDDTVVPVTEGEAIFAAARQPKSFVSLPGTDHLAADPLGADRLAETVVAWFVSTLQ